ncbi:MAG: GDSL-type esterase/lipase family protein [bacterium]
MSTLFIGDSITAGFPEEELLPGKDIVNRGISGTSTAEIVKQLSRDWFNSNPSRVFICLGTNDLARGVENEGIISNLKEIVKLIKAYSNIVNENIFLLSLFPTRQNKERPNVCIDRLNVRIQQLTYNLQIDYLHLNVFFRDQSGSLIASCTEDGLHLNYTGYKLWASVLQLLL